MTQKKKDIHPSSRQNIERLGLTNLTSALNPQFAPEKNSPFHEKLLKIPRIIQLLEHNKLRLTFSFIGPNNLGLNHTFEDALP